MFKNATTIGISSFSILLSSIGLKLINNAAKEMEDFSQQMQQPLTNVGDCPFVSVLVPARNEEAFIGECLVSILHQDYPQLEVIAIDDNSTDRSSEILANLVVLYPERLRLVSSSAPVDGWLGKNNALWQGYLKVNPATKWLLFVDADTRLYPETVGKTIAFAQDKEFDMVSLVPKVKLNGFWQHVVSPEILKFYTFAATNPLHRPKPGSVDEATAVGPFILARREVYAAVDGHRGIKNQVVEDVELARRFRAKGFTTVQKSGFDYLEMTPYQDLADLWESVAKNLFVVARRSWPTVGYVIGVELLYGIVPFGLLLVNSSKLLGNKRSNKEKPSLTSWLFNLGAIVLLLGTNVQAYRIARLPGWYGLFYPLAAVFACTLMLDSAYRTGVNHSTTWKNRRIEVN